MEHLFENKKLIEEVIIFLLKIKLLNFYQNFNYELPSISLCKDSKYNQDSHSNLEMIVEKY